MELGREAGRGAPARASLLEGEESTSRQGDSSRAPDQCSPPQLGSLSVGGFVYVCVCVWGCFFLGSNPLSEPVRGGAGEGLDKPSRVGA